MINPDDPTFGGMGIYSLIFSQFLSKEKQPSFSGKGEDWTKFKVDFLKHHDLLVLLSGGKPLPSELKLHLLQNILAHHSKKTLKVQKEKQTVDFDDFWGEREESLN